MTDLLYTKTELYGAMIAGMIFTLMIQAVTIMFVKLVVNWLDKTHDD